jgi:beta-phosphoglucomutase-like phosphatase (HAD superfamily)
MLPAGGSQPPAARTVAARGGYARGVLGLPDRIEACLFDLDGVLTQTAKVHAAAWKQMFDEFLACHAEETGEPFREFDARQDYDAYVDGKPRYDGVASFLRSRGIELPAGTPDDPPAAETVDGLGNRKNELVLELIERDAGLRRAVVSSSTNCRDVLDAAGILDLFEAIVDGVVAQEERLNGKPAPDTFVAGAERLGVDRERAAVFEDALAGVEAGRAGRFGFVVGVDRVGPADALRAHGADVVVSDLAEMLDRP